MSMRTNEAVGLSHLLALLVALGQAISHAIKADVALNRRHTTNGTCALKVNSRMAEARRKLGQVWDQALAVFKDITQNLGAKGGAHSHNSSCDASPERSSSGYHADCGEGAAVSPPEFDRWVQLDGGGFAMKAQGPDALGMAARIVEAEHAGHQALREWLVKDGRKAPAPLSDADLDHLGERIRAFLADGQAPTAEADQAAVNADQVRDLVRAARFFVDAADVDSAAAVPEEKALIQALAPFDQVHGATQDGARSAREVLTDQVAALMRQVEVVHGLDWFSIEEAAHSRHIADNGVIHTFSVAADDHGQVHQVERPDPVEPGTFCTSPSED